MLYFKASVPNGIVRFAVFEVDLANRELRKRGLKLKIQDQPFQVLAAMLERSGEVVTREELVQRLWPEGTFVDFDHSLNAAVAKLRQTLQDSAETPRYIETVARRGYRFLAPVQTAAEAPPEPLHKGLGIGVGVATILILAAGALWLLRPKPETRLEQITNDPGLSTDPALSPDGKLLAYASDRDGGQNLNIWVKQLVPGGKSVQLTHERADAHQPSFSPDGSKIVYRSEIEGGGVYVIPTIGGAPVLLAPAGRNPLFSPDGRFIAYWVGVVTASAPETDASGTIFVIPASGSEPKRVGLNLPSAGFPIWSEDSRRLLVYANPRIGPSAVEADWWTVTLDGSASKTQVFPALRSQGFLIPSRTSVPRASSWINDTVVFSAQFGDSRNIWRIHVGTRDGLVSGKAERLTSGTTLEVYPSATLQGSLVFASLNQRFNIWALPADPDHGAITGEMRKLTDGSTAEVAPSISADGRKLVYGSNISGREDIWLKDLETGKETAIANTEAGEWHPTISRDGSMIGYDVEDAKLRGLFVVPSGGGKPAQASGVNGFVFDWTPDNQQLLFHAKTADANLKSLNLQTGVVSNLLGRPGFDVFQSKFSPDGQWLAFLGVKPEAASVDGRLFIVKLRNGSPEQDWILISDEHGWADKPRWSPDGNTVYYISELDGFRCLWAQRLDPRTKRPVSGPIAIRHFHESRLSPMNVGLGNLEIDVAKDKIVMNLGELTGNIWSLNQRQ